MNKGDKVRWNFTDDDGEYSYTGTITRIADNRFWMKTATGKVSSTLDDGTFTVISKGNVVEDNTPPPVKKTSRKKNGPTKVDLIVDLLKADPPTSRKDAIEKIVAAGISTPAGASTFYNQAKKMLP